MVGGWDGEGSAGLKSDRVGESFYETRASLSENAHRKRETMAHPLLPGPTRLTNREATFELFFYNFRHPALSLTDAHHRKLLISHESCF